MKRQRNDLIGIDLGRRLRAAASEILRDAEEGTRKREIAAMQHSYDVKPELAVLIFEEQSDPPRWRMETLQPVQNGIGIVKVYDEDPELLECEMREKLKNLYLRHGVRETIEECRALVTKGIDIRCMGRIRLKDRQNHAGES